MVTNSNTLDAFYSTNNLKSKPRRIAMSGIRPTSASGFTSVLIEEGDVTEVKDAKCECCGMSEECTPEYISCVRREFVGRWICGLCSEAVKGEMEKNGGALLEALDAHMAVCVRFNGLGRSHPALLQAEDMKKILRKSSLARAKSTSPREGSNVLKLGGITRSYSCIPGTTISIAGNKE